MGTLVHHRETHHYQLVSHQEVNKEFKCAQFHLVLPSLQSLASIFHWPNTGETRGQKNLLMGLEEQMEDTLLSG